MCVNIRDFSVTYSSKLNEVPSIFLRNKERDIEKKIWVISLTTLRTFLIFRMFTL